MIKQVLSITLFCILAFSAQAQKYGYFNSGLILEEIAKSQNTDKQLEDFQKPLIAQGEKMVEDFEVSKNAFYEDANKGILSQVAIQQRQVVLQEEQQKILNFEKEIEQKILAKREEILSPIFTRVQEAIDAVAKENNYTMIFDSSIMNAILYTQESDDIKSLVRAKLGM